MPEEAIPSLNMLYCYAPEDRQWAEEIDGHLRDLKRQCHIISRFDGALLANARQKEHVLALFPQTDLVLLLVSPRLHQVESFWNEISHESWDLRWLGGCRVVVLLLEPVAWKHAPFACREVLPRESTPSMEWQKPDLVDHLEVFPRDVRPFSEWPSQDLAFQNIEQWMRVTIERQWLARGDNLRDEGGGFLPALAAYDEALRLNPLVEQAWYGKAHVLTELQRYEEALHACDEAQRLDPANVWVRYVKGNALAGLKRDVEALEAYDEAIRLDPAFHPAWNAKGAVLAGLQRYDEALHAYDEALRGDPASASAWYWKGETLKAMGRRKEARQAKRKARQHGWPF